MELIASHQEEFARTAPAHCGLFDGTGCGKTRTALHAVRDCDGSVLVIAPKSSVQKRQWQHEARVLGMAEPLVISKEDFRRDHLKLGRFRAVIIDESHNHFGVTTATRSVRKVVRPKASQLFEATVWYVETHKPDRLILATATPNKTPLAVWAAGRILGRQWDYAKFRHEFYTSFPMQMGYRAVDVFTPRRDPESMERLAAITRGLGRVLRLEDIRDVPEQTFRTVEFGLTKAQTDMLRELPNRFTDAGSLRTKRHQVENGVLYEDVFDPVTKRVARMSESIANEKIGYVLERATEFKKMVVFANYRRQVSDIARALREDGHENVFELTGDTKDRKALWEAAEALDSAYIVAQAGVSSEWEFKTCPVVIWASLSNKSLDYIQGRGRIQRYDAVKANLYIHLVTDYRGSVDRRWFDCIMTGRDYNEALFDRDLGIS